MRISSRTIYGMRLMVNLALNYRQGYSLLKDIAKSEDISEKYLSLIVIPLRSAGLLNTIRGSKGGYILARPPADINVKDIIDILEGDLNIYGFVKSKDACIRASEYISRDLWIGLGEKIKEYMSSITLEDLIESFKRKNKEMANDYNI